MPKKTKRAKKRADARRNLSSPAQSASQKTDQPGLTQAPLTSPAVYSFQLTGQNSKPPVKTPARTEEDDREFRSIKRDLAKTVILACLAFAVELVLFVKFGS